MCTSPKIKGEVHTGILVGRPEGKRQLGRPRCTWEYNIKMDPQEVEWGEHGLD
jgi:hypothetical protein